LRLVSYDLDGKSTLALYIMLPSGRNLVYRDIEIVSPGHPRHSLSRGFKSKMTPRQEIVYRSVNQVTRRWETEHTYGAKLVENVVQAVARDVMANAMRTMQLAYIPIAFTVHDEVVTEVQTATISRGLTKVQKIMETAPNWAKGLPVAAEVFSSDFYRK
jgi:DNA polymerase